MPGQGASDGEIGYSARVACSLPRVRPGLVRTGDRRNAAFARRCGPDQEIGRAVRTADRACFPDGGLHDKWRGVQRRLDDEMVQLALCEGDREGCVSPAALQFLAIVEAAKAREGRARLGEINRAINLAVRPVSDLAQYGRLDVWSLAARDADAGRRL